MTARRLRWPLAVLAAIMGVIVLVLSYEDGSSVTAPPSSASRAPASARCTEANLEGVMAPGANRKKESVRFWQGIIGPAYRAACSEDYRRLAQLLEFEGSPDYFSTAACSGCTSLEIVAMWREEYGFRGIDLSQLLESRPVQVQGGLMFRRGNAVAWFARGTYRTPGQWTAFYPRCDLEPDCVTYASDTP
ncbi:hypothetical protein [Streptomyces sp. OspMP-M43]|uniref:hypothetical protein n=1 Tax=Streptomyces sp. OspMP-M43 TaxID=1839781 RepID=UPI00081B2F34|nr:hypothetical protein [Streptomyces sp. OspMP-M43]SCE50006.1 hypothetical protein GA0115261_106254 [Streptomyces sp. OspMP-M43]